MKQLLMTSLVLVSGLFLTAGANAASIVDTDHNFSGETWSKSQICLPCHTPHNADTSVSGAPLWNHQLSVSVYDLYSSATLDATDLSQPTGVSKLCLSCHDGTVALENFGGVTTGSTKITGSALIGGNNDLSGHHPVSFTYGVDLVALDAELHDPTATASGITPSGNIDTDMLFGLGNDQLECSSCHDVHGVKGFGKLLLMSNVGSALCLTCHDK